ncbi:MAG: nucleotidyltransferase family protein [Gemmatimonadetes bacterium]|nr:nucleotidyltransferase family protein [Gemmatimonadota bacterium]
MSWHRAIRLHKLTGTPGDSGKLVASVLAGAWRASPPPPPSSLSPAALIEVTPLLLGTGAGGLGWWRVRSSELRTSTAAHELRQAYRLYTLQARRQEPQIVQAITLLRSAGVEPLLVKGWAVARLYPERGLRPYGDIDLCVPPEQHAVALAALAAPAAETVVVDLHKGLPELHRPSLDDVYERSQLVPLGDVDVRILGPEDHLRYMCIHMLRHGAYRALWLCDIAVVLESLPQDFDWEYLLQGDRRHAGWVASTVCLAHQLLGARLDGIPVAERARHLPRWFVPSVLSQWSIEEHYMASPSMAYSFLHPAQLLGALRLRWPNPIQATVGVGGPFNELPRWPFQLWECVLRTTHFLTQVPTLFRQRSLRPVGRGEHATTGGKAVRR